MAGAFRYTNNQYYYLYDAYGYETQTLFYMWWTMTPINFTESYPSELISITMNDSTSLLNVSFSNAIRPVINLKDNLLWNNGVGTKESPYTVKVS